MKKPKKGPSKASQQNTKRAKTPRPKLLPPATGGHQERTAPHQGDGEPATEGRTVEEMLSALFRAVFMAVRHRFGAQTSPEVIERVARQILNECHEPDDLTWASAEPVTAGTAKRARMLFRAVRIAGHIVELCDPQVVLAPNGNGAHVQVEATSVRIEDREGSSIWSIDVVGERLINKLGAARGRFCEFLGMVIALPIAFDSKRPDAGLGATRQDFFLHIVDLRPTTSALDLIGATAAERERVRSALEALRARGVSPCHHLKAVVVERLGIVGLERLPVLGALIDFAILQAVACGWVAHSPGTLHLAVVGPPASGKKLVQLVARLINPVSVSVSAARASPAGLVGASSHADGRWTSTPGALPRASGGVAVMQDAHSIGTSELRKLVHILQEVAEDGRTRSSVAGGVEWEAVTSIMLDLNAEEQAWTGPPAARATILNSLPLLSRLDSIVSIPRDDANAWLVAEGMYAGELRIAHVQDEPWVRELKLLVAALRDEHPIIRLDAVQDQMAQVHRRLAGKTHFGGLPQSGNYATRLTISFRRLVIASARANDRKIATREDVVCAVRFLGMKLHFLRSASIALPVSVLTVDEWLLTLSGEEVTPADAAKRYTEATGVAVHARTMRRHLKQVGRPVAHGKYKMPEREK